MSNFFYAVLNQDNICVSVIRRDTEFTQSDYIQLTTNNTSRLNQKYDLIAKLWIDPVPEQIITITNVTFAGTGYDETQPDGRVDLLTNTNVTIGFDVALPNGTKLTIPVRNNDTGQLKVVKALVLNGAISKNVSLPSSGIWKINSEEVNRIGRQGVDFRLDDITLLVQDI